MRNSLRQFHQIVNKIYESIIEDGENQRAFEKAAVLMARTVENGRLIYLCGPGGHSNMHTEECLCRAGMIVQLSPMIDTTNLLHGTTKTRFLQRSGGYAKGLLEEYDVNEDDVIIVINAYGINYLTIDMAIEAKKKGLHVIGITSKEFGKSISEDHPARHANKKNLEDVCDVLVDCKMPLTEAVIDVKGCEQKVGPTSTLCNVFTIHLLMLEMVELLADKAPPNIWRSINMPGGDAYNAAFFRDYGQRIKYLL